MKKVRKSTVAVALALALAFCAAALCACGGGAKLDEGAYEGVYKIIVTEGSETKHYGSKAAFTVDDKNCIWDIAYSAPDADWQGAEAGEKYVAPAVATGAPWNAAKATSQFSGWTVAEFMKITVDVDENGRPNGKGCVKSDKEITIGVDCDEGIAFLILAVQNAVKENAK